jgi:hypothetical protein
MVNEEEKNKKTQSTASYTIQDAIKIADDIFKLGKENKYNLGAFIHGLVFANEYAQYVYRVPQQQIAMIKRDCRKYFEEIEKAQKSKVE